MKPPNAIPMSRVLRVIERLATEGKAIKEIAWEEGMKSWNIYEIRERFPLLCWKKKE